MTAPSFWSGTPMSATTRLPSKWRIEFCDPIDTAHHGPDAANDRGLVLELTDQVRETVQQAVYANLVQRGPAFV
jgi:hypothetical protein